MEVRGVACIGTHQESTNIKPSHEVIYRKMALFINSCWSIITNSLIWSFSFIAMHLFRIRKGNSSQRHDFDKDLLVNDSRRVGPYPEVTDSYDSNYDSFEAKESPSFSFKFQYQFSDHHICQDQEQLQPVAKENKSSMNTSIPNYRFSSEKDFSGFMEESEAKTCSIQESFVDPGAISFSCNKNFSTKRSTSFLSSKDFHRPSSIAANHDPVLTVDKLGGIKDKKFLNVDHLSSKTNLSGEYERTDQARFLLEEFSGFDSDSESLSASDGYSVKDLILDSASDGFLSEREFDKYEHQADTRYKVQLLEDVTRLEETQFQFIHNCHTESAGENINQDQKLAGNESDNSETQQQGLNQGEAESNQVEKFEESKLPTLINAPQMESTDSSDDELHATEKHSIIRKSSDGVLSSNGLLKPDNRHANLYEKEAENSTYIDIIDNIDSTDDTVSDISRGFDVSPDDLLGSVPSTEQEDAPRAELDELEWEELDREENVAKESIKEKETDLEDLDDDDYDELESLWEHQDLIEQLKMEMRRVRAMGLPTILEESEAPKTVADLKPWKIDEKFLHEDPMDELHKFYKSYRERMRKFDILNYQKMYAIGFLQLKDPLQSMGSQKTLIPTLKSILSQSFWPCSLKTGNNPSEKFIKELQNDLELIYVGQTCLSWEFLCWQYEKARRLPESDPYRSHQYNQVAGEFQQFQVIMQRFIEDETFQGPRLPNYAKNRCVVKNLLQVPVIKEDNFKEKLEDQHKGNYIITSEILEEIMEESIRIFWEFVKADKDESPGILKGLIGNHVELQDSADFKLMADIQSSLHKKEKKLKDILRTGNCLVKKFKKPKEDRSNQDLFFSQVDLKLVAKVLRMSRIADEQLVWCHAKLSNLSFIEGKVYREPAFLLFPC